MFILSDSYKIVPLLELLEEEDSGEVGLEAVEELEAPVQEAHRAVVGAEDDPSPPARAARDRGGGVGGRRDGGGLLLEELELPPLIHHSMIPIDSMID